MHDSFANNKNNVSSFNKSMIMKKIFATIICILIPLMYSFVCAQSELGFIIALKRDSPSEIKPKGDGIFRSPAMLPATAVVGNMKITVNIFQPVANVTIMITNTDTGEVLYANEYISPNCVEVPLDAGWDNSAGYRIDIISDAWTLYGEF